MVITSNTALHSQNGQHKCRKHRESLPKVSPSGSARKHRRRSLGAARSHGDALPVGRTWKVDDDDDDDNHFLGVASATGISRVQVALVTGVTASVATSEWVVPMVARVSWLVVSGAVEDSVSVTVVEAGAQCLQTATTVFQPVGREGAVAGEAGANSVSGQ